MATIYPPIDATTDPLQILKNLADVETTLQKVLEDHRDGKYGYITREWGFSTPDGLGGKLGGKFQSWEDKLEGVASFFWPIEAYSAMEEKPYGKPDPEVVKDLPPQAEQLPGNTPLHEFLLQPPSTDVVLEQRDYEEYRDAARIFLLLATLSHLCGNSAPDPKTATLPSWIEDPLIDVANRLDVEPTLTGHFVVQDNWVWASEKVDSDRSALCKRQDRQLNRSILRVILTQCQVEDRRYHIKVYHSCFVGSQLVDVLMQNEFASSREEAVRLARRINHRYGLFYHVTGDHRLMDKYLFYRFRKKWRKKQRDLSIEDDEDIGIIKDETSEDDRGVDADEEFEPTSRLIRPLEFLTRNASLSRTSSLSETAKLELLRPLPRQLQQSSILDQPSFRVPSSSITEQEGGRSTGLHGNPMNEIMTAIAVLGKVPVKDRRYRFRVYKQCFVGKELVDAFMENDCARTRSEAVALGRKLNNRFELFEHVVHDHDFKDEVRMLFAFDFFQYT
jgi:hypothetical protein